MYADEDLYEVRRREVARPVPSGAARSADAPNVVPDVLRHRECGELPQESGSRESEAPRADQSTSRARARQHRGVPVGAPVLGLRGRRHRRSRIRPSRRRQGRRRRDVREWRSQLGTRSRGDPQVRRSLRELPSSYHRAPCRAATSEEDGRALAPRRHSASAAQRRASSPVPRLPRDQVTRPVSGPVDLQGNAPVDLPHVPARIDERLVPASRGPGGPPNETARHSQPGTAAEDRLCLPRESSVRRLRRGGPDRS